MTTPIEGTTPRPWTVYEGDGGAYIYAPDARYESLPDNPSPVKVAWMPPANGNRPAADAALIVAAVNDYDRLRAIEDAARAVMIAYEAGQIDRGDPSDSINDLREALR